MLDPEHLSAIEQAKCFSDQSPHTNNTADQHMCACVCVCVCVCVISSPEPGVAATKAPAKCFLFRIPYRRLWRQKRQPNVSYLESRAGGCGDKSAGQMFLRIYVHAHNVADQHMYGCVYSKEFQAGVMATKAPAISFLYRIPYGMLWRQKRRPNVSSDLCTHTPNAADKRMYGRVYYIESRPGGYGDKSAGQMLLV